MEPDKARIHMVQSHSSLVVKEIQSCTKRNFKDSHSLFEVLGNYKEKASIWCTATLMKSPSFSPHFTHFSCIWSHACLSTISPGLFRTEFRTCLFPLLTSSLLSVSWLCTMLRTLSEWLKNNKTTPFLVGGRTEEIGLAITVLLLVVWGRVGCCRHSHITVLVPLSALPDRQIRK